MTDGISPRLWYSHGPDKCSIRRIKEESFKESCKTMVTVDHVRSTRPRELLLFILLGLRRILGTDRPRGGLNEDEVNEYARLLEASRITMSVLPFTRTNATIVGTGRDSDW